MKRFFPDRIVREETGSGLLATLLLITMVMVLVSAVLAVHLVQYRFIRRDAHRVQARYAAEAGVYIALDSLQHNLFWRGNEVFISLPEQQACRVTVESFGGYVLIRSVARYRRSQSTLRALVGEVPPAPFHNALYVWDTESSVHVAGRTRITGAVVVGPRGLKESTFERRRYTGRVGGPVRTVPNVAAPFFDGSFLHGALEHLDRTLNGSRETPPGETAGLPLAKRLPSENPILRVSGSLRLTEADSLLLREPLTVVVQGNLILEGPLRFEPGTVFIAGQVLSVRQAVTGRDGLFFGRQGVEVSGAVRLSGQFFSRKHVRVARGGYLAYPSVLYVTGEAAEEGGSIRVEGGTAVNGLLVHPPIEPAPTGPQGRIIVEPAAQVRGAIFNAHETEFHGLLYGSLLTHQLYFYESPTRYVNWLKDAVLDVDERPIPYVLPLGFSPIPRLAVLRWDAVVEELSTSSVATRGS